MTSVTRRAETPASEPRRGRVVGATLRPASLEAAFRLAALREDGRDAAIVIGFFTLLSLPFVYNDLAWAGRSGRLGEIFLGRVVYVLSGLSVVWIGLRGRKPAWLDRAVLANWTIGSAFTVVLQSTRPADFYLPAMINAVGVLLVWVVPSRYLFQALGAAAVTASCVAWIVAYRVPPPSPVALLLGFTLVTANLAGAFVSFRLQRSRRRQFLAEGEQVSSALRLSESEELFRSAFENAAIGKALCDPDGRFLRVNEALCGFLGLGEGEVVQTGLLDACHPDDRARCRELLAVALAGGSAPSLAARFVRGDGATRWGEVAVSLLREPAGRPRRLIAGILDIDERRRAEDALQATRTRYAELYEGIGDGIVSVEADGRIVEFNEAFRRMLGFPSEELRTLRYTEITPASWHAEEARRIAEQVRHRIPVVAYEKEYRRADGTVFPVELRTFLEPGGEGGGRMWAIVRDISEERGLRNQLAVASRLAAMGTLVAGMAHEINNPLAAAVASHGFAAEEISSLAELVRSGEPLDRAVTARRLEQVREAMDDAQVGEIRIAAIVKDLTLLGRTDARRAVVSLPGVVEQALDRLPEPIRERATFRVDARGCPDVEASEGQLVQILVNLLTNAALSGPVERATKVHVRAGAGSPGMARIEVEDDGTGMTPEVLGHMFDPFFTTRGVGEGTGLGLAICHAIVSAHGGTISATSEVDRGTVLCLELPVARGAGAGPSAVPAADSV